MRATILAFVIIAACDFIEPGECRAPRSLFGPCVDNECDAGMHCFSAKSGDLCVPPSASSADAWETTECAAWTGDLVCDAGRGFCYVACDNTPTTSTCEGGTVCDAWTQICVHPYD